MRLLCATPLLERSLLPLFILLRNRNKNGSIRVLETFFKPHVEDSSDISSKSAGKCPRSLAVGCRVPPCKTCRSVVRNLLRAHASSWQLSRTKRAGLICIHININLHRNGIRDECAQLLLLCIYNKLHCKCWQHFTKQRGGQNILWESKSKWSTVVLKRVPLISPKFDMATGTEECSFEAVGGAPAFAWMAK